MTVTSQIKWKPLGIVLSAAIVAGCAGTTYGTGVNPGRQTIEDLTGVVSLGKKDTDEPIQYVARPAIVAPPKNAALPKPGDATNAANWPKDPDEAERQRQLAAAGRSGGNTQEEILADPGFRLPKATSSKRVYNNEDPHSAENEMRQVKAERAEAEVIFAKNKKSAAGKVDANGNPVRTTLTEPPATYRVPDPDAQEEFVAAKDEKWWQVFKKGKSSRTMDTKDEDLVFTDEDDIRSTE